MAWRLTMTKDAGCGALFRRSSRADVGRWLGLEGGGGAPQIPESEATQCPIHPERVAHRLNLHQACEPAVDSRRQGKRRNVKRLESDALPQDATHCSDTAEDEARLVPVLPSVAPARRIK